MVRILLLAALCSALGAGAQGLGFGMDRGHCELRRLERETEHFLIIYPEHLEAEARETVLVAENAYGPLAAGLGLDAARRISIVISDEDQMVNGFALPGKMFVWVNPNDYVAWVSGGEPWLRTVVSHELQHDLWFEAAADWTGVWGLFGTPPWFVEGIAEYSTEAWGTHRSDVDVREKILENRPDRLDPHDSGFTMVRYLAETYGDSVLVRAVRHRNFLGLSDFPGGFKKAAGIGLSEFREEWRRAATAYTYALYGQKEAVEEIGPAMKPPMSQLSALAFSADSTKMALLGRPSRGGDWGLHIQSTDSTARRREIDHGRIDASFSFSPDGEALVYAKLHRVGHGSLVWDLKVADLESGENRWITWNRRASHPHWSPAGEAIVFTAVDGRVTNLYRCDAKGDDAFALTQFTAPETRILDPRMSPDGRLLACSLYERGGNLEIWLLDLYSGEDRVLTRHEAMDRRPVWGPAGERIYFSSDRGDRVPNIHVLDPAIGEASVAALSDVGEAILFHELIPGGGLATLAMASTDTLRLRELPLDRRVAPVSPAIRDRYVSWMDRLPEHPLPEPDYEADPAWTGARAYHSWRHIGHLASIALPSFDLKGIWGATVWMDAAHRQRWLLGAELGLREDRLTLRGAYLGWQGFAGPGILNLSLWKEARHGLRLYGDELLRDRRSGGRALWQWSLNFGEHLYAEHELSLGFISERVEVLGHEDLDLERLAELALPEPVRRHRDAAFELSWNGRKERPARAIYGHPQRGQALRLSFRWAATDLGGDYDYRRLSLDGGRVQGLPLGTLSARLRGEWTDGAAPPQEFTGLRSDGLLLAGLPLLAEDFFRLPEPMSPRGIEMNLTGDAAALMTVEWAVPLIPPLPVWAFGFSPGGLSGVAWLDEGHVRNGAGAHTRRFGGWEARLPLRIAGQEMIFPSVGQAWNLEDGAAEAVDYFRLAAVWFF